MLMKELIERLAEAGVQVTKYQVTYAMRSSYVRAPGINSSDMYVFDEGHVQEYREYFTAPRKTRRERMEIKRKELATV